jgi:hypothetical protein
LFQDLSKQYFFLARFVKLFKHIEFSKIMSLNNQL